MINQLKTTINPLRGIQRADSQPRSETQPQLGQKQSSSRSINYTRKSSRDLLNKAISKQPQERSFKLILQQPRLTQPVIISERFKKSQTSRPSVSKQFNRTLKLTPVQPLTNLIGKHHNKSFVKELFCQKAKDISKKINQQTHFNNQTIVDFLIRQFDQIRCNNSLKLLDLISKSKFQQIILKLSGISYVNVTKPIWNEVFYQREANCLGALNFLLALFKKSIDQYKLIIEKPAFMYQDRQENSSLEKRKILIKKSISKPKVNEQMSSHHKLGKYSCEKGCIMFSAAQKEQIYLRYNYLRTQIENKLKDKYSKGKQNSTGISQSGQITLKVHLNNELTSMKINQFQSPAEIARKFAIQQKLDQLLQHKLCFFLSKQLKNF